VHTHLPALWVLVGFLVLRGWAVPDGRLLNQLLLFLLACLSRAEPGKLRKESKSWMNQDRWSWKSNPMLMKFRCHNMPGTPCWLPTCLHLPCSVVSMMLEQSYCWRLTFKVCTNRIAEWSVKWVLDLGSNPFKPQQLVSWVCRSPYLNATNSGFVSPQSETHLAHSASLPWLQA